MTLVIHRRANWVSSGHYKTGANTIATQTEAKEAKEHHIKKALCKCGYPSWVVVKAGKAPKECSRQARREQGQLLPLKQKPLVTTYLVRHIRKAEMHFFQYNASLWLSNPKTETPKICAPQGLGSRGTNSNIMYAVKC